jgi:hypothetical protein
MLKMPVTKYYWHNLPLHLHPQATQPPNPNPNQDTMPSPLPLPLSTDPIKDSPGIWSV